MTTHHQTIDSEIAELSDKLEDLRHEGRRSADHYAKSLPARAALQDKIQRLRNERQRIAIAAAAHSADDLGDNWTRSVGLVEFTVKVAGILAVFGALAFLMSRCTV